MARARNIKPGLFKNEVLGVADPLLTILFTSLWCLADRDGILEDRPLRIKAETFPYREGIDINGYLTELERLGFIHRYTVDDLRLITIVNFDKHQNPHHTEKKSIFPKYSTSCAKTVISPLNNGITPADSLNTDSLNTDSKPSGDKSPEHELKMSCSETWKAYAIAYESRYGAKPVRNQTVNSQLKSFVKRIGLKESPLLAAWYVSHPDNYYSKKCHGVGQLLADCEKLRTEWATGKIISGQSRASPSYKTAAERQIEIANEMFGELVNGQRNERDISQDRTTEGDRSLIPVAGNNLRQKMV